jgi:hypothetical protein
VAQVLAVVDGDQVPHGELVLHEEEEARDDVLHQGLGAEAEGHAGDAGARHQGSDVDAELLEGHQQEEDRRDHPRRVAQDGAEGVRPALGLRGDPVVAVVHGTAHGLGHDADGVEEEDAGQQHQGQVLELDPARPLEPGDVSGQGFDGGESHPYFHEAQ